MATKTISISLDAYENTLDFILSLKPKTELTDNIEKAMLETRKAKLQEIEL
jgi:predicted CopG family antitoxin